MKARPKRAAIVAAHPHLIPRLLEKHDGDFDPASQCWACAEEHKTLERAHVKARVAGGGMAPSNFFLLCRECHKEQPDGASESAQVLWLLEHESWLSRFHRHFEEVMRPLTQRPRFEEWFEARCSTTLATVRAAALRVGRKSSLLPTCKWMMMADYAQWAAAQAK